MYEFKAVSHPVRIHAGQDALEALPAELQRCGARRAFLVCGKSVAERTDLIERIRGILGDRLVGTFSGIAKDAPQDCVLEAVEAMRPCRPDILLAVGAGSVIKAGRIIAILLAEDRPIEELITRYPPNGPAVSPKLNAPKLPIINILTAPTTAQNRSGAALRNLDLDHRMEFFDPKTRPQALFWDAGALLTAQGAFALSTAMQVYWRALMNMGVIDSANPLVQGCRYQAFRLAQRALPRIADPGDYQARIDLCAATLLQNRDEDEGGRPLDLHWIARVVYALSAATYNLIPSVGSGEAHCALTGAAIRQFGGRCLDVTISMGRAIGAWEDGMDESAAPQRVGDAMDDLFRGLGVPARLRELGVGRERIDEIIGYSLKNFNADRNRSFVNEVEALTATMHDAW